MPHSSGKRVYSQSEKVKIAKEKKNAGRIFGAVGSGLKAAALGKMSPAAKKRQEYLRQRAIQDSVTGRRKERATQKGVVSSSKKPSQPSRPSQPPAQEKPVQGESATRGIGFGSLLDALNPELKKRGKQ